MTRLPMLRAASVVMLCLLPAPAVIEYQLPRPKAFPHDPAVGADGIVWYTDQANSYIGRLDPATGKVTDYATPTPASGPHGIVVAPDGGVWYTGNFTARLGRLDPASGVIKEFPPPKRATRTRRCSIGAKSGSPSRARTCTACSIQRPAQLRSTRCRRRAPGRTAWWPRPTG